MGEQFAGAAHPGLHLIHAEDDAVFVAHRAQVAQELQVSGAHAALALDRLDDDAAGGGADRVAHRVHIVERHVVETIHHRAEALQVVRVAGGGERRQGAAVERALEADEAEAFRLAAVRHGAAHHLDHALVRLRARVAEEHAVRERRIHQPRRQAAPPAGCGTGSRCASPWRPVRRSPSPGADGHGPARRWRCRSRNRGIVARPPSTTRRLRPARKRGRHGRSSAAERGSLGVTPVMAFFQWIARPRPIGAGPEEARIIGGGWGWCQTQL